MIQAAVADVVGPAVAAHDPDGALDQHVGDAGELGRPRLLMPASFWLQHDDALALFGDAFFR